MLISLSGLRGSGKGTVSKLLQEQYGYVEFSISKPLKDIISHLFDWDRNLLEGNTIVSRNWRKQEDEFWSTALGYKVTPELMMTKIGTDLFRNMIGDDFWILVAETKLYELMELNENIIIERCSYINEINFVKKMGGFNVFVDREFPSWRCDALRYNNNEVDFPESLKNVHSSEYSLIGHKFDFSILNIDTLEVLEEQVDFMIDYFEK